MVEYIKCITVLLFAVSAIKCENCVTYDFEDSFDNSFNHDNPLCSGMGEWILGNYSTVDTVNPYHDSDSFITPNDVLSCVSSYKFEVMSSGVLEVYVYMDSKSVRDQIIVLANEVSDTDKTVVTGTTMLSPLASNYYNGWHVLRTTLNGPDGVFSGYVSFLGVADPESTVIVDSFRYIPPKYEEACNVYDEDFVTSRPPEPEKCFTHAFEDNDFEEEFSSRGFCSGFTQWQLKDYESVSMDSPSSESDHFITPDDYISCSSSFVFPAQKGGIVEVNVYMQSTNDTDQIAVVVTEINDKKQEYVAGTVVLSPLQDDYVDGWQTIRATLSSEGTYNAYVTFLGLAGEDSVVLIDSFRYIPPTLSDEICQIYEDNPFTTTTPPPPTTVAPIGTGDECITFNFESDFEKTFDNENELCNGQSSWHLGDYHSLAIESTHPDSHTFITPNDTTSCISSLMFKMKPGGVIEANVYMDSASEYDYIIIIANKVISSGRDSVAGFILYYGTNADFVKGWNVLRVTITDFDTFNGYITIVGSTAEDSIVLIDSFKYTPPNHTETCEIY